VHHAFRVFLLVLIAAGMSISPARANETVDLKPIYRIPTSDRVAFITIDDGWDKSAAVRDYIERNEIPVTSFITTSALGGREGFFRRVSAWGSIQNHSVSHAAFGRSSTNLNREICGAQRRLTQAFGIRPWMLRPPYGDAAHSPKVARVARSCGITHIVMWDALVWSGRISYRDRGLKPGSIILLHFNKSLEKDLRIAMRMIKRAGLTPANLDDYLVRREPSLTRVPPSLR
jgi:peptidoglycan/xylan/chitin deacetylase (PgdA/CDA1 family)